MTASPFDYQFKHLIYDSAREQHILDKPRPVTWTEVEYVLYEGEHRWIQRAKSNQIGRGELFYVYGRTLGGRYILIVLLLFPDGNAWLVTARDMDEEEKKRYKQKIGGL